MTELLTAAQMRAIEQAAIASGEVTGLELMERAGRGVVDAVFAEWPELAEGAHRAAVLCGPGGNGGDGFVVARLLKERGWEVEVFLYGDPDRMPQDARVNYGRWLGLGEVRAFDDFPNDAHDLIIDAVFGIGLSRSVPSEVYWCLAVPWIKPGPKRVAVDVPSYLCADSGRAITIGLEEPYDLTVTFQTPKPGHYLAEGPEHCGKIVAVDIGLASEAFSMSKAIELCIIEPEDAGYLRKLGGHKYEHGHALILSGPSGHGGAARLAARGSLRIGAGVVTVGCPAAAVIENASRLDAIMLRAVGDAGALAEVMAGQRINALCLGPGMGVSRAKEMLAVALQARRAVVLDADALTALAEEPALFAMLHERCVLTPHAGEFARLFPDLAARLAEPATKGPAYSKVDATRAAAARAGCVVLFKGADTVIAAPDRRCSLNSAAYERAAPWLATAGSGDVLAGFITGLLARGFAPMQAAETAAWLHVDCARNFGPGLIAEDLPEQLPAVFRALGL